LTLIDIIFRNFPYPLNPQLLTALGATSALAIALLFPVCRTKQHVEDFYDRYEV